MFKIQKKNNLHTTQGGYTMLQQTAGRQDTEFARDIAMDELRRVCEERGIIVNRHINLPMNYDVFFSKKYNCIVIAQNTSVHDINNATNYIKADYILTT
jgi:hypothetical protein